jgi:Kef-type K+ transport system membrane component KefB
MNYLNTLSSTPIEYQYLALFSAVLLLPKLLLRFQIPTGITALILGCLCVNFLGWFDNDQMVLTLARLGITSLFLFAGMEIDIDQLKKNIKPLSVYILQSLLLIFIVAIGVWWIFALSFQISLIISIALFTPSAGFILNSLKHYDLEDDEIFWIKLKAISKEIAAIAVLLVALQLDNLEGLLKAKGVFLILFFSLPLIFKFYLRYIAPHAPKSEVSFLVIMAFLSGVLTKKLGTHYLVGAFATGIIAGQFNHFIKDDHSHRIENSLSAFYGIFVPFYFFSAGLIITKEFFTLNGLMYGACICLSIIPLRIITTVIGIKYSVEKFWRDRMKISVSLIPNLIFGLVIIGILKQKFEVDIAILSGLLIYTLVASIIPAIYFEKNPPEDFDISRYREHNRNKGNG